MNNYEYNQKMSELCRRASRAFCAKGDKVMSDVYEHAENGFYDKAQRIALPLAGIPVSADTEARIRSMEAFVSSQEEDAAWAQRAMREETA